MLDASRAGLRTAMFLKTHRVLVLLSASLFYCFACYLRSFFFGFSRTFSRYVLLVVSSRDYALTIVRGNCEMKRCNGQWKISVKLYFVRYVNFLERREFVQSLWKENTAALSIVAFCLLRYIFAEPGEFLWSFRS